MRAFHKGYSSRSGRRAQQGRRSPAPQTPPAGPSRRGRCPTRATDLGQLPDDLAALLTTP